MKTRVLFFILLASGIIQSAFACDPAYYLNDNNECKLCEGGYYCPGDDARYACPPVQSFCDAAAANEPDLISMSCILTSWSDNNSYPAAATISDCRARPQMVTSRGRYYYSVLYKQTTQSYPLNNNTKQYWQTANAGYYLSNLYSINEYTKCNACTNAPANAHYTGAGTPDVGDCPWECDSGYGQTNDGQCLQLCQAGVTEFHAGDLMFNIYANKQTTPSINIKHNDTVCYVSLAAGTSTNAVHVKYQDTTYHTIN